MQNLHIFNANYFQATNKKPSRIKVKSYRFNQYIYVNNNELGVDLNRSFNWVEALCRVLEKRGFSIVGFGQAKTGYDIISTTFEPLKK